MDKNNNCNDEQHTACQEFVNLIVQVAADHNKWYFGPDINQRKRTGIQIADMFIPHDHIAHRVLGSFISPCENRYISDVSGFKPELVAGGQGTEAYRHIGAAIAAVLEGCSLLIDLQNQSDHKQLQEETCPVQQLERKAELADNAAGRKAGEEIMEYLNEKIGKQELKSRLLGILCSEV